jgi:hypothetical protein
MTRRTASPSPTTHGRRTTLPAPTTATCGALFLAALGRLLQQPEAL